MGVVSHLRDHTGAPPAHAGRPPRPSAVDRRFNRCRYDAARTIQAFSARLRQQIELDT